MNSSSKPEANSPALNENIRRVVALSALRKIRSLVDRENAQEALEKRFVTRFLIWLAVGLLVLAAISFFYGAGAISRPIASLSQSAESGPVLRAPVAIAPPTESAHRSPVVAKVGDRVAEYSVASYVEEWRRHIETYATAHYPKELRTEGLAGNVVLMVTIKSDGVLEGVSIFKSSGSEKLDRTAIALVRNASPYPKFPEQLRARIDVIEMTKAFRFSGPDKREP